MTEKLEPVWEPKMWGKRFNNDYAIDRPNRKGKPMILQNFFTPEGSRFIARCQECGGIMEALADMRKYGDMDPKPFTNAVMHLKNVWEPKHHGCADNPLQWSIPPLAAEMLDRQLEEYRDSFKYKNDFEVLGHLMVVSKKGKMFYVPYGDIPYGEGRASEAETRKFAVRELLLEDNDEVLFQLSIMEAWSVQMPHGEKHTDIEPRYNPFRTENITATIETPEFTKTGAAVITRLNRKDKNSPAYDSDVFKGPAEVGPFEWGTYSEGHLIEGIIAANQRFE